MLLQRQMSRRSGANAAPPHPQGYLISLYHGSYWMGLSASGSWAPDGFGWADHSPGPGAGTYTHWGTDPDDGSNEPNNLSPPELCGAANASQVYDNPEAWGWSDVHCGRKLPFICKAIRERRASACLGPLQMLLQVGIDAGQRSCCCTELTITRSTSDAAPSTYAYVSTATNNTYLLNTTSVGFVQAELSCNDQGGHLVTYGSFADQQEVEQVGVVACAMLASKCSGCLAYAPSANNIAASIAP
jgi:hypothetical protein